MVDERFLRARITCRGKEVADWCMTEGGCQVEVVERPLASAVWSVLPKRWIVERTFGRISLNHQ